MVRNIFVTGLDALDNEKRKRLDKESKFIVASDDLAFIQLERNVSISGLRSFFQPAKIATVGHEVDFRQFVVSTFNDKDIKYTHGKLILDRWKQTPKTKNWRTKKALEF